jgi:hypothetical protein
VAQGPRREFIYWADGVGIAGLRYDQWKLVFMGDRSALAPKGGDPTHRHGAEATPRRVAKWFRFRR